MYGNENISVWIFQIQRDIASLHQDGKSFSTLLGSLKVCGVNWRSTDHVHTVDAVFLQKRTEEEKIFKLLASLGLDYEDLRSHILMNTKFPALKNVCAAIQCESVHWKVMPRAVLSCPFSEERVYKGKCPDLKCQHCHNTVYPIDRCWIIHPELKPKFAKDHKGGYQKTSYWL